MRPNTEELRRMYCEDRMTTRQIGTRLGVTKTTVRRWLVADEIALRPAGRGMAHRGVAAPSADELRAMVHEQHLSYADIGARYDVAPHTVMTWVRRYEITPPTLWETRRRGRVVEIPESGELARRYADGESLEHIAGTCGVSSVPIAKRLRDAGVTIRANGWKQGRRWVCTDGHVVRSSFEQRVDEWLHAHGLAHEIEPRLPWNRQQRADFLVGETYIEVWGVVNRAEYRERKEQKRRQYRDHELKLVELAPDDFAARSQHRYARKLAHALLGEGQRVARRRIAA